MKHLIAVSMLINETLRYAQGDNVNGDVNNDATHARWRYGDVVRC